MSIGVGLLFKLFCLLLVPFWLQNGALEVPWSAQVGASMPKSCSEWFWDDFGTYFGGQKDSKMESKMHKNMVFEKSTNKYLKLSINLSKKGQNNMQNHDGNCLRFASPAEAPWRLEATFWGS